MVDFAKALHEKRGEFTKVLAFDCETSGINLGQIDPAVHYKMVSAGFIVANINFEPIEELYIEFKWDDPTCTEKFYWDNKAEAIHGLSQKYLNEHGKTEAEAAEAVGGLIYDHWGLNDVIVLLGTNVASFDQFFLRKFLERQGLKFKFSHRMLDTFSLAMGTIRAFNSTELFELIGCRGEGTHNALQDAGCSLKSFNVLNRLWRNHVN
jgi:hypothetical protein